MSLSPLGQGQRTSASSGASSTTRVSVKQAAPMTDAQTSILAAEPLKKQFKKMSEADEKKWQQIGAFVALSVLFVGGSVGVAVFSFGLGFLGPPALILAFSLLTIGLSFGANALWEMRTANFEDFSTDDSPTSTSLEDAQRRLEEAERRIQDLEAQLRQAPSPIRRSTRHPNPLAEGTSLSTSPVLRMGEGETPLWEQHNEEDPDLAEVLPSRSFSQPFAEAPRSALPTTAPTVVVRPISPHPVPSEERIQVERETDDVEEKSTPVMSSAPMTTTRSLPLSTQDQAPKEELVAQTIQLQEQIEVLQRELEEAQETFTRTIAHQEKVVGEEKAREHQLQQQMELQHQQEVKKLRHLVAEKERVLDRLASELAGLTKRATGAEHLRKSQEEKLAELQKQLEESLRRTRASSEIGAETTSPHQPTIAELEHRLYQEQALRQRNEQVILEDLQALEKLLGKDPVEDATIKGLISDLMELAVERRDRPPQIKETVVEVTVSDNEDFQQKMNDLQNRLQRALQERTRQKERAEFFESRLNDAEAQLTKVEESSHRTIARLKQRKSEILQQLNDMCADRDQLQTAASRLSSRVQTLESAIHTSRVTTEEERILHDEWYQTAQEEKAKRQEVQKTAWEKGQGVEAAARIHFEEQQERLHALEDQGNAFVEQNASLQRLIQDQYEEIQELREAGHQVAALGDQELRKRNEEITHLKQQLEEALKRPIQ